MENIFKNKLSNYEETPPDFILENLKSKINETNSSFFNRNKYYIAASVVVVAIISSFILFNNDTKEQVIVNNSDKIAIIEKEQPKAIETNPIIEENIIENNTDNETNLTEVKTINTPIKEKQNSIIYKNINAGNDAVVCGNTYKMAAKNTTSGVWITNANVIISDKNNPNTEIISNITGSAYLIWKEKQEDNYILDTVKITFVNSPKSDIGIEQTNEVCANKNAEINFITDSKYNYTWNDGFKTDLNFRKNLSAGTYTITVSNTTCSSTYNVEITNSGSINVDFNHTELYNAVNIPFYFTNNTTVDLSDNVQTNYIWEFGDGIISNNENPEHTYKDYGTFNVKLLAIADNGCKDSLTLKVKVDEKEVKMPNIFTPNGDGKHDVLILKPKPLTNYYAAVYDRNGREITHWNDPNIGWNGKLKSGDDASEGVYYYIVSGIDTDGKRFNYKSFVHLTR